MAGGLLSEWRQMKLKSKLLLATSATVLVVLAASEWVGYSHTAAVLRQHEARMQTEPDHAALVNTLRVAEHGLLTRLASLHVIHAVVTILAMTLVLNLLWYRLFIRRLDLLLRHINSMRLGTWTDPVPVERVDEIGQLCQAFNALGEQLTMTVQQFASASKLSAIALLGQRFVRKTVMIGDHLEAVTGMLEIAKDGHREIPEAALHNLRSMITRLQEIPGDFEAEFAKEFDHYAPASTIEANPATGEGSPGTRKGASM